MLQIKSSKIEESFYLEGVVIVKSIDHFLAIYTRSLSFLRHSLQLFLAKYEGIKNPPKILTNMHKFHDEYDKISDLNYPNPSVKYWLAKKGVIGSNLTLKNQLRIPNIRR